MQQHVAEGKYKPIFVLPAAIVSPESQWNILAARKRSRVQCVSPWISGHGSFGVCTHEITRYRLVKAYAGCVPAAHDDGPQDMVEQFLFVPGTRTKCPMPAMLNTT